MLGLTYSPRALHIQVLDCAQELGVVVKPANQYERAWTRMTEARNAQTSEFRP